MSNIVLRNRGGTLARVAEGAAAAGPMVAAGVRNLLRSGAQERAIQRGVEAASGVIADQVSTEVVNKIVDQAINNPAVHREIARQLGPIVAHAVTDRALNWLWEYYQYRYYTIWTIISVFALFCIRIADLIVTGGFVTGTGARITYRGLSATARTSLKSMRAIAKAIRSLGRPRSSRKKTQMLVLFVVLFGSVLTTSRPVSGSIIAIAGPYLANRVGGGNNATNVRAAVNNAARSPNRRQESPNRQFHNASAFGGNVPASFTRGGTFGMAGLPNRPRGGVASAFNTSVFAGLRSGPRAVTRFRSSTPANNAARAAARRARFAN
jgi:hypothetical protein